MNFEDFNWFSMFNDKKYLNEIIINAIDDFDLKRISLINSAIEPDLENEIFHILYYRLLFRMGHLNDKINRRFTVTNLPTITSIMDDNMLSKSFAKLLIEINIGLSVSQYFDIAKCEIFNNDKSYIILIDKLTLPNCSKIIKPISNLLLLSKLFDYLKANSIELVVKRKHNVVIKIYILMLLICNNASNDLEMIRERNIYSKDIIKWKTKQIAINRAICFGKDYNSIRQKLFVYFTELIENDCILLSENSINDILYLFINIIGTWITYEFIINSKFNIDNKFGATDLKKYLCK